MKKEDAATIIDIVAVKVIGNLRTLIYRIALLHDSISVWASKEASEFSALLSVS